MIAALYAMKAILDSNIKLNKRVRLILGLNEEKSSKCIDRYKETEEFPNIGFSPDANFPAIYAEKGIISISLKHKFNIKGFDIINSGYFHLKAKQPMVLHTDGEYIADVKEVIYECLPEKLKIII